MTPKCNIWCKAKNGIENMSISLPNFGLWRLILMTQISESVSLTWYLANKKHELSFAAMFFFLSDPNLIEAFSLMLL